MRDLMHYFPDFYENSREFAALQKAYGAECGELLRCVEAFKAQLVLHTATWGLLLWEKAFGVQTDLSQSFEIRRENVRAKWRARGIVDAEKIQTVAEAFANGQVEVQQDARQYYVGIRFSGMLGIPRNIRGLTTALGELMPAHLYWNYIFVFNTWGDVNLAPLTWGDAGAYTWGGIREVELNRERNRPI